MLLELDKNNGDNSLEKINYQKPDIIIDTTKQKLLNQVETTIKISQFDKSLESYSFLSSDQKELIIQINTNHPNVIEKIISQAITIVTEKGKFELPLIDTEHPYLNENTNISQEFQDKRNKLFLTNHKYYTPRAIVEYYKSTGESKLSDEEFKSIIELMPGGDPYIFAIWGKSMKQFTILLGLTHKDLTSWTTPKGGGSRELGRYGYVYHGLDFNYGDLPYIVFNLDRAAGYSGFSDFACRARLIKRVLS